MCGPPRVEAEDVPSPLLRQPTQQLWEPLKESSIYLNIILEDKHEIVMAFLDISGERIDVGGPDSQHARTTSSIQRAGLQQVCRTPLVCSRLPMPEHLEAMICARTRQACWHPADVARTRVVNTIAFGPHSFDPMDTVHSATRAVLHRVPFLMENLPHVLRLVSAFLQVDPDNEQGALHGYGARARNA